MSDQPFDDGPEITGSDPGEALIPGHPTDAPHTPQEITAMDIDYVHPAEVPEVDDAGGKHL